LLLRDGEEGRVVIRGAGLVDTSAEEVKDCDRETKDSSCKDEEENADLGDDSDDDCDEMADALDNPQLEQLLQDEYVCEILREKNDSIVTLVKQRETYKVEKYKED
jgi:predicted DNA-binding antitoxin AbrB/MazE fold protein